jgi:hypothetical protein
MLCFATEEKENPPRLSSPARPYAESNMKMNTGWSEVEILFHDLKFSKNVFTNTRYLVTWTARGLIWITSDQKGCIRSMQ